MHEIPRLQGSTPKSIVVQTSTGRSLENFIGPAPTAQCERRFQLLLTRFGRSANPMFSWEVRRPSSGGYNCAGMVWAARHTCLPRDDDWRAILLDDGYRRLSRTETPMLGDVAVYVAKATKSIVHVGRICRFDPLVDGSGTVVSNRLDQGLEQMGSDIRGVRS